MKVALCQINPTVGSFSSNIDLIEMNYNSAIKNGADGIIIFWPVYKELMENPLTDKWNKLFLDQWNDMFDAGNLKGLPIK